MAAATARWPKRRYGYGNGNQGKDSRINASNHHSPPLLNTAPQMTVPKTFVQNHSFMALTQPERREAETADVAEEENSFDWCLQRHVILNNFAIQSTFTYDEARR